MNQKKGERRRRRRGKYRRDSAVCGVYETEPTSDGNRQEQARGMWFVVDSWVHTLNEAMPLSALQLVTCSRNRM